MYKLKFRTKLIVIFLFTAVVQAVAIGLFPYYNARDIVIENKQRDMRNQLNLVDININTQVRYFTTLIENMADSELMRTLLRGGRGGQLNALAMEYFTNTHSALGSSNHIFLVSDRQILAGQYPDGHFEWQQTLGAQTRRVYQQALAQAPRVEWHGLADSLVEDSSIGGQVLRITSPVYGGAGPQALGAVIVELDPQTFGNILLNAQNTFQNQYTFIVDKENQVVCSNKMVDDSWVETVAETFDSGTRRFYAEWSGTQYYVCGQYNGVTGWRSFSVLSMGYLAGQAEQMRRYILFSVLLYTGMASVAIIVVSFTLTRPIMQLSRGMERAQQGDFSVRLNTRRRDEMGMLMGSFDYMEEKIDALIREVYEEKIAQQNAEMEALQNQINPHFLYNTLDSINWMLIDHGEMEVSDVIVALGDLMKYAVDTKNDVVKLEQELHYIRSYLFIQKTRMENRLQYQIHVPRTLYGFPVPKLILQPLVENAILHGIAGCGKGGVVTLCAREEGSELHIEVCDDGKGIDAEKLAAMRQMLDSGASVSGIGIYNVNKRLRLRYGAGYSLRLDSTPGQGTRAVVRIPKGGTQ